MLLFSRTLCIVAFAGCDSSSSYPIQHGSNIFCCERLPLTVNDFCVPIESPLKLTRNVNMAGSVLLENWTISWSVEVTGPPISIDVRRPVLNVSGTSFSQVKVESGVCWKCHLRRGWPHQANQRLFRINCFHEVSLWWCFSEQEHNCFCCILFSKCINMKFRWSRDWRQW